jgi:hypothetical protein
MLDRTDRLIIEGEKGLKLIQVTAVKYAEGINIDLFRLSSYKLILIKIALKLINYI